jgi:hypothetical protein
LNERGNTTRRPTYRPHRPPRIARIARHLVALLLVALLLVARLLVAARRRRRRPWCAIAIACLVIRRHGV